MALLMRFLLVFVGLFCFSINLYAQIIDSTIYRIEWRKPVPIIINGIQKQVLTFTKASHIPKYNFLPLFSFELKGIQISSAEIQNTNWIDVNDEELKFLLDANQIQSECLIGISNGMDRNIPVAGLSLVPLRRNLSTGKIEKLLSFNVRYNILTLQSTVRQSAQFRLENATNSVLSQGDWYKLGFEQSGIYKLDYSYLQSIGIKPSEVNPSNIQIWGNGGGMLPELCSANRPTDLTENAIYRVGAEDGKFDPQDYILFYVQGPNTWKKNDGEPFFRPVNNIYSKNAFYFLTVSNYAGKSIQTFNTVGAPIAQISTNSRREVHELELKNFLNSGRKWYGEEFVDINSRTFYTISSGVSGGSMVYLQSSLMNKSNDANPSSFTGYINENYIDNWVINGAGTGNYIKIGYDLDALDSINSDLFSGSKELRINYRFQKTSSGNASGYLNYYALNFSERLQYDNVPLFFRNITSANYGISSLEYVISKSTNSNLRVWDITSVTDVAEATTTSTNAECRFSVEGDGSIKEFLAFTGTSFPNPISFEKIGNQNIRGASSPNLLIVTNPLFITHAQRLADFRTTNDGLEVLVVTTDQLYNEFSSGAQDLVAIRDCARMFYNRNDGKFKNLLLFGGASYDYKNLNGYGTPTSFVPIYESETSLDPIFSYSSDDYVALLNDDEGIWDTNDPMDIGVGRLPVSTVSQADAVVSKLINYSSRVESLGNWRQKLTYVADGGDSDVFLDNAEKLTESVKKDNPNFNINKIYVAAYNKVVLPDATFAPDANNDIVSAIDNGTFIVNYIGHGSETQWSAKNIMNTSTIQSLGNQNLPFIVTATCDFGRYDAPNIVSGGQLFLLHPNGGAVGLLTTTRPVYQTSNEVINSAFHDYVFNKNYTLGEILRLCKNSSRQTGEINRNFALLGDPSMTLAYPKKEIVLTKINGRTLSAFSDTLKAQAKVTFTGEVRDKAGSKLTNFNGVVDIVVFDKSIVVNTVDVPSVAFNVVNKKIFDGSATVKNGDFVFTFIVSKDINYRVDLGKISLYANVEDGGLLDAGGSFTSIYVGSSEKNVPIDNTPPQVKAFINDESFVQGGITNQNPMLIVKLYDESGISSVGGFGSSITATLTHENSQQQFVLDNYYKSDRDSYQSGTIKYRLSDLKEGNYTVKIEASDANKNNIGKEGNLLEFNVINNDKLTLNKILNFPNPFTTNTTFHFDHNRAGDDLEVMLQVFTVTGKLVKTITSFESNSNTHISDLHWDGKDEYGDNIGRGVYVYKLSVKALSDGAKKDEYQKLVILN